MRDFVLMYVNGVRREVRGAAVFMMAADWLRKEIGLVGTKIVCAEGDCGVCTILRAVPSGAGSETAGFLPINSCIATVAHLDCSSIVTVEGVRLRGEDSPVQRAMQECHGSQCGYCTPGFVMAMSGLFERYDQTNARTAANYLTGNLCRCTGYAPILAAAVQVKQKPEFRADSRYLSQEILLDLQKHQQMALKVDLDDGRSYYAPTKVAAATKYAAQNQPLRVLGAGTDLGVQVNKGRPLLPKVLSLRSIPSLNRAKVSKGRVIVGANCSLAELRRICEKPIPEFANFLNIFASPQIKNVATLVGNVANGSPIGDTLPFLLVSDAVIHVQGMNGSLTEEKSIPVADFFRGYKQLALQPHELITHVSFCVPKAHQSLVLLKSSQRKDLDISTVSAAFLIERDPATSKVVRSNVAYGGVAATPVRLPIVEESLTGRKLDEVDPLEFEPLFLQSIKPLSDVRGSADYRRVLALNLFCKMLETLRSGSERSIKTQPDRLRHRTLPTGRTHA